MKAGELKKVATAFSKFFPLPWKRVGNEFMRREKSWVQIGAFGASRFSDQYAPRNCFEYLLMPGPATGTFLSQELKHPNGTQRWIDASNLTLVDSVFSEMVRQFKPSLLAPLDLLEIKQLLESSRDYWPHSYALCIMSLENENQEEAEQYFADFSAAIADKPYSWAEARKRELTDLMAIKKQEELISRLQSISEGKLKALKF
jgi:hypothetical protein